MPCIIKRWLSCRGRGNLCDYYYFSMQYRHHICTGNPWLYFAAYPFYLETESRSSHAIVDMFILSALRWHVAVRFNFHLELLNIVCQNLKSIARTAAPSHALGNFWSQSFMSKLISVQPNSLVHQATSQQFSDAVRYQTYFHESYAAFIYNTFVKLYTRWGMLWECLQLISIATFPLFFNWHKHYDCKTDELIMKCYNRTHRDHGFKIFYHEFSIGVERFHTGNCWQMHDGKRTKYSIFLTRWIGTTGLFLGLRLANERRRYKITPSLIGWAQTAHQPWDHIFSRNDREEL